MKNKSLVLLISSARGFFLPFSLIFFAAYLALSSYQPGTWLSGWDTLHPEFNFSLAFERLLFGVFRPDQGLGAVAAHAHMSDLPRVLILFLWSFVLSADLLRYSFISLCLILGVLGVFIFAKKIIFQDNSFHSQISAFLGALFYLLNLGTLQNFYVPFEMFAVLYASLPWLFFFASSYLQKGERKFLVYFSLVTLFSTPMAFASTLWFAYFLSLLLFLALFLKKYLRRVLALIVLTLVLNSFWLLPNLYFVVSGNAAFVPEARINKIFSQEMFAYNLSFSRPLDVLTLKSFLFDWYALGQDQTFIYLMAGWREHLASETIQFISLLLTVVALIGVASSVFKKNIFIKALLLPMLVALTFLINPNLPNIPLFEEALRAPFTKFSTIVMFSLSCFFALGQQVFAGLFKGQKKIVLVIAQAILFSVLLIVYTKPAFTGDFISKAVQVKIPAEYFEMFSWFDSQPQGRVAVLPVHSIWGWIYYNWGFQGAQFISFGIKQPILDRDFDRWNPGNEEYYKEISYALYSQNLPLVEKVLDKYRISYLMLDKNVVAPGPSQDPKILFFDETESLLTSSKRISLAKKFNNILIYKVQNETRAGLQTPESFIAISGQGGSMDIDPAFNDFGDYVSGFSTLSKTVNLPFRSLTDNQNIINPSLLKTEGGKVELLNNSFPAGSKLSFADYLLKEPLLPANLYLKEEEGGLGVKLELKLFQGDGENPPSLIYHLPAKTRGEWFVNVDNNQTVRVKSLTKDFVFAGTVFLSSKTFNNLAFYQGEGEEVSQDIISKPLVNLCSSPAQGQVVGASFTDRGVAIQAKNAQACIRIPLREVVGKGQKAGFKDLSRISFGINSSTNSLGHYCIFDRTLGRCIKERKYLSTPQIVEDFLTFTEDDLDRLELVFFLDGVANNRLEEVDYSNLMVNISKPENVLAIPVADLQHVLTNLNVEQSAKKALTVNFSDTNLVPDFNLLEAGHNSSSCSTILPKNFSRRVDVGKGVVEYTSENGSSCDFFSFPNLSHNSGYLLLLESQNVSGLPLRVCVANPFTKRCDLYLSLPKNKDFSSDTILIPPVDDGGAGFDIHLDNYSVGRISTANRIRNLQIIPFPYHFLTGMQVTTGEMDLRQRSGIKLVSEKQILPGLFDVTYDGDGKNPGLLVLNQSFDNGFFMGDGEHVKFNGWANGWIIDPSKGGSKRIIYWPQLLEFLGLLFVGGAFSLFFISKWKCQRKN